MGTPVPHKRFSRTRQDYTHIDPWADMVVNDVIRASTSHYASHNAIVVVLAEQATVVALAPRLNSGAIARPDGQFIPCHWTAR